jgi:hypothetical protein
MVGCDLVLIVLGDEFGVTDSVVIQCFVKFVQPRTMVDLYQDVVRFHVLGSYIRCPSSG